MPHDAIATKGPGRLDPDDAARLTRRITWASVSVALMLTIIKAVAFERSGSVSLLASLGDSALDFCAALMTFFVVRYAASPADEEHRFGHGKAESFAALFQAGLVVLGATLIGREAIMRLLSPQELTAAPWALGAMAISVVATLILVRYQTFVAQRTGSVAIEGDRAHFVSDIIANLTIIAAIALTALGAPSWLDALIGLAGAAWLLRGAWDVVRGAVDQIMDREISDDDRARIAALITASPAILAVHDLRTRASGPIIHIQAHVDMAPDMRLREAHAHMVDAERRVIAEYPGADILLHPDPHEEAEDHGNPHLKVEGTR